ncbi:MAG: class I SAM-dependent methyltransferase [bacterium]|nr:class I SAM-dependent methyltransferase [bacterium]
MEIDHPITTELRRSILLENRFLRAIYEDWYELLAGVLPSGSQPMLEVGSGASFFRDHVPGLISTDIWPLRNIDIVTDAQQLPLGDRTLRAIAMTNVLHHIPNVRSFLSEAARCVVEGGALAMVEPWLTSWSRFFYTHLHHEPFEPAATDWTFSRTGPLSGANGALPWIVFERDRPRFEREFPMWRIEIIRPIMPLRYLMSGGMSWRPLMPAWTSGPWRALERVWPIRRAAMFALIVLRRVAC